jgi:hypothetical protein
MTSFFRTINSFPLIIKKAISFKILFKLLGFSVVGSKESIAHIRLVKGAFALIESFFSIFVKVIL